MKKKTISISKEFSMFPAGRYETDGPYTGEGFRKKHLTPALRDFDQVVVELDNALGYGSSFLEEAFGGLIRVDGFTLDELNTKLDIRCNRKSTILSVQEYLSKASNPR